MKSLLKKVFAFVFVALIAFAAFACGKTPTPEPEPEPAVDTLAQAKEAAKKAIKDAYDATLANVDEDDKADLDKMKADADAAVEAATTDADATKAGQDGAKTINDFKASQAALLAEAQADDKAELKVVFDIQNERVAATDKDALKKAYDDAVAAVDAAKTASAADKAAEAGIKALKAFKDDPALLLKEAKEDAVRAINYAYDKCYEAVTAEEKTQMDAAKTAALAAVEAATTVEAAAKAGEDGEAAIYKFIETANGAYSYVAASYEERTKILAALEEYALKAGLTGITLYQSAGYALYNTNVTLGTDTYIVGYGFGAVAEGTVTGDGLTVEGENPAYAKYYHTYETEDPNTINYGDDKGSVVGDLVGYVSGSYWGTRMNETKDGYEWYADLAKDERPIAENANPNTGLASKWKFQVKIGSELKYSTLSTKFAKYNNQEVKPEDYLTPYKLLFTQKNGWARALDNSGSSSEIKGSTAYYNASADGFNETAWQNVGLSIDEDGTMHIEFASPCTQFYAMYYASSSIYAPIPAEFIEEIGGADKFGNYDSEAGLTPVDTILSTGPFVLEAWVKDAEIVFKKNPNFNEPGRYNVEGVHFDILKAMATDQEAAFKEFMAGNLSACGVPSTQLDNFKGKESGTSETNTAVTYVVKQTNGGSTYKLNANTCDQATWEDLFGVNGTITQTARENYWQCEPIMSNHDFYLGLSYALNRPGLAAKLGVMSAVDYFGDVYQSDPEGGVVYNSTPEHKAAITSLIEDQDHDGYDLEMARAYFKKACDALLADGTYKAGDKIEIEIAWMYPTHEEQYHNFIKKCFEDAFNDNSVSGGKLTLEVKFWVGASWSDVYYDKMMTGQYDLGFGSISGNSLNPLNFLEVLKSDNSSGFTLNWGVDTSKVDPTLKYDGVAWSFDSLWLAADQGGFFKDGLSVPCQEIEYEDTEANEDGSQTITIKVTAADSPDVNVIVEKVMIFAYLKEAGSYKYYEDKCTFNYDKTAGTLTVTVSAELAAKYAEANLFMPLGSGYNGIDVYFATEVKEVPMSKCDTLYDAWILGE